jgi:hypothetical protein
MNIKLIKRASEIAGTKGWIFVTRKKLIYCLSKTISHIATKFNEINSREYLNSEIKYYLSAVKNPLHNSGEALVCGSRWAARRLFAVNSPAIGKKNNAADRSSPRHHRPQGVIQRVLKYIAITTLEVAAWGQRRNTDQCGIEWSCTRQDTDLKLGRHYVSKLTYLCSSGGLLT